MNRLLFLILASGMIAFSLEAEVPPLLPELRRLQENVLPTNTSYRHNPSTVRWKGTDGATAYIAHTDCSGLINALLRHTYHLDGKFMKSWLGRARPKAKNYFRAISEQDKFIRISLIQDVLPGDIIAIKFLPWAEDKARDTGHVMVVDALPKKVGERSVDGHPLEEWAVAIIDSSHGHGKKDTRYREGRFWPGLGRGTAALYTDRRGDIVGYSWTTAEKSVFYGDQKRPLVVGRLRL